MSNEVITLLDILSGTAEKIISTPDVIILTTLSLPGRILSKADRNIVFYTLL